MILKAQSIKKEYMRSSKSKNYFEAVKKTDFVLEENSLTEITGRSGSGKSTFLYMLSGLLRPTEGIVTLDGINLYDEDDKKLSEFRNKNIGIIPQGQTGIFSMTVLQNVLLPCALYKNTKDQEDKAKELLEQMGILHLSKSPLSELSGGEMRRMAIARALLLNPKIILADEPTDDLDEENTKEVLSILKNTAHSGCSVLLVTHEAEAAKYADFLYKMESGSLSKN